MSNFPEYLDFWGLKDSPFFPNKTSDWTLTPSSQKKQWNQLLLNIQKNMDLLVVQGEPGSGRSKFAKWIFNTLPTNEYEVISLNFVGEKKSPNWLWEKLSNYFSIAQKTQTKESIAVLLDEIVHEHKKICIILDNADYLKNEAAMEEIKGLLNAKISTNLPITFILISMTGWGQGFSQNSIVKTKTNHLLTLAPLSSKETKDYVVKSLNINGVKNIPFDNQSLALIHSQTKGNYHRINTLAEGCLMEGFFSKSKAITAATLSKVANQQLKTAPTSARSTGTNKNIDLHDDSNIQHSESHGTALKSLFYSEDPAKSS